MELFRRGLVFKAHVLLYHSTPGSKVKTKKEKNLGPGWRVESSRVRGGRIRCLGGEDSVVRIWGLGSSFWGWGRMLRVWDLRSRVEGLGFRV